LYSRLHFLSVKFDHGETCRPKSETTVPESAHGIMPPHSDDVVKFFNAWPSPFAQRAWIALNKKGLEFEKVDIDPSYENKPPELLKANPKGKVPTIVHKGEN
jgi:hypothetical protein